MSDVLCQIDLEAVVESSAMLTPPPMVAIRLAAMVMADDWELEDVEALIRLDPALTGRVLRIANSAELGGRAEIATVRDAVLRVGAGAVVAAALAAGTRSHLTQKLARYGAEENVLWQHSIAALLATEGAAEVCGLYVPPPAFTAALLHDVGKLILGRHLSLEALRFVLRGQVEGGLTIAAAEREILGVDHAELGALIVESWGLPGEIGETIRLHHAPWEACPALLAATSAVHVADTVASRLVPGPGEDLSACEESDGFLASIAGGEEGLRRLKLWVAERLERTVNSFEA